MKLNCIVCGESTSEEDMICKSCKESLGIYKDNQDYWEKVNAINKIINLDKSIESDLIGSIENIMSIGSSVKKISVKNGHTGRDKNAKDR